MSFKSNLKVALLGNPNSGKTSLFNHLTGLNQKVGNFPGVTVDKKTGECQLSATVTASIIDLPGTYSLYPKSYDERIVFDFLNNPNDKNFPDLLIVIADASNLKRNLLLFTQVYDLGFPVVLALNMLDVATRIGVGIDIPQLSKDLKVPIVSINARTGKGLDELKHLLLNPSLQKTVPMLDSASIAPEVVHDIKESLHIDSDYKALQLAHQFRDMKALEPASKTKIEEILKKRGFDNILLQSRETIERYELVNKIVINSVTKLHAEERERLSNKIDKVLTHTIFGYVIFLAILFTLFQAIFSRATLPMEIIDHGVTFISDYLKSVLPAGPLTDLLTEGLIAGLGGILIFIPQIAILFTFISLLEESGYMSRVVFMMDKIMRKFGMNGKSVVPLISGVACAVPAIMATRSIDNWKDRLITIFVTPLMSCSARIPVYTILIALVVPQKYILGLNLQGLVLMGLYLLGFVAAILSAWLLKLVIKSKQRSFFIMEFPPSKVPRWKNVGITIVEKVKAFVWEAGKVIVAISIILWALATYGPAEEMEQAQRNAIVEAKAKNFTEKQLENKIAANKLEASYAGHFGHFIEPAIRPLGFDWKIGIALLTSFAAREVFIGTMATIYSIGDSADNHDSIKEKMQQEVDPHTGKAVYTLAMSLSLLVFYAFAMQCMSTLAVVYRETKSWKWPTLQFVYMTGLAYVSSLLVYSFLK